MSELHAWDVDETLRAGNLTGEVLRFGINEGFFDPEQISDPLAPTKADLEYFIGAVAGLPLRIFLPLTDRISDEARTVAAAWALERIDGTPEHHHITLSHAPDFMVKAFSRGIGKSIRASYGSFFQSKDKVYTGRILERQKVEAARRYARNNGLNQIDVAISDHITDLKLLKAALKAIVVNPDEELAQLAAERGWEIVIDR